MSKHFLVLGNHPDLALAELLSILPQAKLLAFQDRAAVLDVQNWDGAKLMNLLGGTVKLGDIVLETKTGDLNPSTVAETISTRDAAALDFGFTAFVPEKSKKQFEKFPMAVKKVLREKGHSVRWVTGDEGKEISPAAVAKCKLLETPNADIVVISDGGKRDVAGKNPDVTVYVGRTAQVQDADAWSARDYGRPRRDDRGGMLPPKLARMMVNLARVPKGGALLDPFCGSGTVLMEAALATDAGRIMGSDIAQRCIQDTQANNDWLISENLLDRGANQKFSVFQSDARQIDKKIPPRSVDAVVTEGWLGPPLRGDETEEHLQGIAQEVGDVWRRALTALRPTLKDTAIDPGELAAAQQARKRRPQGSEARRQWLREQWRPAGARLRAARRVPSLRARAAWPGCH